MFAEELKKSYTVTTLYVKLSIRQSPTKCRKVKLIVKCGIGIGS